MITSVSPILLPRGLIQWKGVSSFAGEDQSTQSHLEAPVPPLSER